VQSWCLHNVVSDGLRIKLIVLFLENIKNSVLPQQIVSLQDLWVCSPELIEPLFVVAEGKEFSWNKNLLPNLQKLGEVIESEESSALIRA